MTRLLTALLGRLPIGWLQLVHNRMRLAAAIAGVAFASILILAQLGFLGAISSSTIFPYKTLNADILILSPETNSFGESRTLPRQRAYQALAVTGVVAATPLYLATLEWEFEDGASSRIEIMGADPDAGAFVVPSVIAARNDLKLGNTGVFDSLTRGLPKPIKADLLAGKRVVFEGNQQTITIRGNFPLGGSFTADGHMVVSDQTFFRLFPLRQRGGVNYILVRTDGREHVSVVVERLRQALPSVDATVKTVADAAARDQLYQTTEKPIGVVFGFGVTIGILVGMIITYQVLSTDVADHLAEYATFKAIGYPQKYFLSIVFEESLILAVLGFVPGFLISLVLYEIIAWATSLPMTMPWERGVLVFLMTVIMCAVSGAIATRRLAGADPADLF
jgi:putative ABC transport system permease protein